MRSHCPVGLFAAIGIIASGTLTVFYMQYSRPNLAGRATEDLMRDVIGESTAHMDEPYAMQLLHIQRQRYVVAEVARRTPLRLARLRRETEVEFKTCPNRVLTMADTTPGHP
jgi:hypothetical protein